MRLLASFLDPIDTPGFDGQVTYKNKRWWEGNVRANVTHFITDDEYVRSVHLAAGKIDYGAEVDKVKQSKEANETASVKETDSSTESNPTTETVDAEEKEVVDVDSLNAEQAKAYAKELTGVEYKSKKDALEAIKKVL